MKTKYFSKDHEWIIVEGNKGIVGITHYAQAQLGDVVFVESPKIGQSVRQGAVVSVIESVKAASEIYSPVSGTIESFNEQLVNAPALVNQDPETSAWLFTITLSESSELSQLMNEATYQAMVAKL